MFPMQWRRLVLLGALLTGSGCCSWCDHHCQPRPVPTAACAPCCQPAPQCCQPCGPTAPPPPNFQRNYSSPNPPVTTTPPPPLNPGPAGPGWTAP